MSRIIVHLDADAFFASVKQAADVRLSAGSAPIRTRTAQ
jgi:nucleotidyltransferase/DNA polymerase involved in DNA repair